MPEKRVVYEQPVPRPAGAQPLTFAWFVDDDSRRVPVLVGVDGAARRVGSAADQLALCDLLDAVLAARLRGEWPAGGASEGACPAVERVVEAVDGRWGPGDWSTIVFSGDVNHAYCSAAVASTRRRALGEGPTKGDPLGWMRCDDGKAHYLTEPNRGACGEARMPGSLSTTGNACRRCRDWVIANRPRGLDNCCLCSSPLCVRLSPGVNVRRATARSAEHASAGQTVTCCGVEQ